MVNESRGGFAAGAADKENLNMNTQRYINKELGEEMLSAVHESGLRVYVFPKKGFSKYYAIYGTEYGSLNRTFKPQNEDNMITVPDGIAHYLEHKMFEDENGVDAFERFAETGASANAYTSFDLTAYLFSCTDRFYENLDILLDFVNHPHFTKENVAKEQGIIGQEIKMYDDDPEWRAFFNTLPALFKSNPVKIDIAGTVESISHITPEILYQCYNTFYNPANMRLILVGDVDIDEVMKYVDKHLANKANLGEIERMFVDEPHERVREYTEQKLAVSQPMFRIGFKDNSPRMSGDELLKKEIATEIILDAVFGTGSDLYLDLYEKGLIDSTFGCETELEYEYGFTLIGGESQKPKEIYEIIKNKLAELIKNGISKEDVERARKVLISQNIRIFNNVEAMGNSFMHRLMNNQNPLGYKEVAQSVTYDEIQKRLCEHFDPNNCVLSTVVPNE